MGQQMIKVYKLVKRHLDGPKSGSVRCDQIKIFSVSAGHGVGTIDFSEKVLEIDNDNFDEILKEGDKYLNFKLGNLNKYQEIEIFPEHAKKLLPNMKECSLKNILSELKEGYLVLRKNFDV